MILLILTIELVLISLYYHYNKKVKKLIGTGRMTDISIAVGYKKFIEAAIILIPLLFVLIKTDFL
ncbi:hypothetical protein [Mucilaginibacter sp. L196]|uniref:hypothetical protein n=1 Tax=Mucilaginibacter sp. L196 TaxID=1641870 RepID=UPI00131BA8A4|nr:hypothetical protein [Mucilaginibacter sp. L196]